MNVILPLVAGAVYVASPGPVLVSTIRWGMRGGMRGGLSVQLGAFIGDLPYIALAVAGFGGVVTVLPPGLIAVGSASVFVLFGLMAIRDAYRGPGALGSLAGAEPPARFLGHGFVEGLVLAVANPFLIPLWLAASAGTTDGRLVDQIPIALGGFFVGNLTCAVLLAAGVAFMQNRIRPRFWRAMSLICGLTLISFGMVLGRSAL